VVVIAPGLGFLVLLLEEAKSAQDFDLSKVSVETSRQIFVKRDPKKGTYSELLLRRGEVVPVRGSYTLQIGNTTTLAYNANEINPFATVSIQRGKDSAILVIAGDQVLFNKDGDYITYLAADGLLKAQYRNSISDYVLGLDNRIYLKGTLFQGPGLGVTVQADSICSRQGTLVLTEKDLAEVRVSRTKPTDLAKRQVSLEGILPFVSTNESMVVMDTKTMDLRMVVRVPDLEEILGGAVCSIARVNVKGVRSHTQE